MNDNHITKVTAEVSHTVRFAPSESSIPDTGRMSSGEKEMIDTRADIISDAISRTFDGHETQASLESVYRSCVTTDRKAATVTNTIDFVLVFTGDPHNDSISSVLHGIRNRVSLMLAQVEKTEQWSSETFKVEPTIRHRFAAEPTTYQVDVVSQTTYIVVAHNEAEAQENWKTTGTPVDDEVLTERIKMIRATSTH